MARRCVHKVLSQGCFRAAHISRAASKKRLSSLPRVNLAGGLWHDGYLNSKVRPQREAAGSRNWSVIRTNAILLYQLAIEYTSLDQPENAFPVLQRAFARLNFKEPFAPNAVVDFIYAAMALKQFDDASEAIGKAENCLTISRISTSRADCFTLNLIRNNATRYIGECQRSSKVSGAAWHSAKRTPYKSVHGSGTFLANYNLGLFYQAFGNLNGAQKCFAAAGSRTRRRNLKKLKTVTNLLFLRHVDLVSPGHLLLRFASAFSIIFAAVGNARDNLSIAIVHAAR